MPNPYDDFRCDVHPSHRTLYALVEGETPNHCANPECPGNRSPEGLGLFSTLADADEYRLATHEPERWMVVRVYEADPERDLCEEHDEESGRD